MGDHIIPVIGILIAGIGAEHAKTKAQAAIYWAVGVVMAVDWLIRISAA